MTRPDNNKPKVISLFTKQEYVEPTKAEDDQEKIIDSGSIAMLEEMIERYKTGELYGVALVYGIQDKQGIVALTNSAFSGSALDNDQMFTSGCMIASHDIIRIIESDLCEDD